MGTTSSIRARRSTVALLIVAALMVVGVAFAAPWTAESNGKAGAKSGGIVPVVASEASPSSELLPGESADAALTLSNPNKVAMVVTSIVANGPIVSSSAACNAAGHGVSFVDQTGSWSIAKNAALDVSLPGAVHMALDSATECQNVTFSIPVRVTSSVTDSGGGAPTTSTTAAPATTTTTMAARLAMSAPSGDYGNVPVGASSDRSFTITNIGGSYEVMRAPTLAGNADYWLPSGGCGGVILNPGQSCTFVIRFSPSSVGFKSAFYSNSGSRSNDSVRVNLTGTAVVNGSQVTIDPVSHDFAQLVVGGTRTFTFVVTNTGSADTGFLDGHGVAGLNASEFTWDASACGSLAPGAQCAFNVTFRPQFAGQKNASVTAHWTDGSSATAQLSGTGV